MNARLSAAENKNALWEGSLVVGRKPGSIVRGRAGRVLLISGLVIAAYIAFAGVRLFLIQPKQKVGRETTFVEGPLREDGTVDFAAALNEEWSKGVTPENNAAVPLARAFGPKVIRREIRENYFELLGIETPAPGGEYLVTLDEYLAEEGIDQERQTLIREGYSQVDPSEVQSLFPELLEWVERNSEALVKVTEASRRERFFAPLIPPNPSEPLLNAPMETYQQCREAVRLLRTRMALKIAAGNIDGAIDDALVSYRLGRLVGHSPALIGNLVGMALEGVAAEMCQLIVLSDRLTTSSARRLRQEIESLPPPADIADTVNRGDRINTLDALAHLTRRRSERTAVLPSVTIPVLDANVVLQNANTIYDSWVDALTREDRRSRHRELERLGAELRAMRPSVSGIVFSVLIGSRSGFSDEFSKVLISLIFPAIHQAQEAEDRTAQRYQLVRVGTALAAYRAAEREYPEQLEELQARHVERLPVDLFSGEELKYRREGEGFLLYSVGANGRDDGGWSLQEKGESDDVRFGVRPGEEEANTNGDEA